MNILSDPNDGRWLREQIEQFIKEYTPLAKTDITTKNDHASGRGLGYEQCIGILRAILVGIPYKEFVWNPEYDLVGRPIQYRKEKP